MKRAGWLALGVLVCASAARADGVADANAGLAALNARQYDRAIALFDRALDVEGLQGDDREAGLACRGRAYLGKGDYAAAIIDLDEARRLKPDDLDAQNDLLIAIGARTPASSVPGAPRNIIAANAPPAPARPSVWSGLGRALIGGAVAGIQQGLQDAAQNGETPN